MNSKIVSIAIGLILLFTVAFGSSLLTSDFVTVEEALEDIEQFQSILDERSSYAAISKFDYRTALGKLTDSITTSTQQISIYYLANELGKIMSEIGDRHSKAVNKDSFSCSGCNLYFPFQMAVLDEKIVAIVKKKELKEFTYFDDVYPYIKTINGLSVRAFLDQYAFRHKKAPDLSRLVRGFNDLRKMGERFFLADGHEVKEIEVVLTDGVKDKPVIFPLSKKDKRNFSYTSFQSLKLISAIKQGDVEKSSALLDGNIAYLNIPRMYRSEDAPEFFLYVKTFFEKNKNTKALIIDIRDNAGGGRELINLVAAYIVPETHSPWVANVAYLRSDEIIDVDQRSMTGRFLHTFNSDDFDDVDRIAITQFEKKFSSVNKIDKSKFSVPFYMLLRRGEKSYDQPVYIMVNERVFSAASVFATAFKGLPNVKIVGLTTDGSSGNSRKMSLEHSDIQVKFSTMVSLQRDGNILDGIGTEPDIELKIDEAQLLWKKDSQLARLLDLIK